ncbi:MAG: nitric oxide reductase NorQ protein, partial [Candidatus Azotimanducaceae bacterium]
MPKTEAVPYYLPLGDEVEIFLTAYEQRLPVLLKGPTGCGKTRFVEYMAHRLFRGENSDEIRRDVSEP